jgi:bacteriocin-like protein
MNHETRELNINELDAVSGGLRRQPDKDRFNQGIANSNKADGTVGSSLADNGMIYTTWI